MAKKESTLLNMVITLLVVTAVASTALGFVYEFTKGPIAAAREAKRISAIEQVLPEFDNNPGSEAKAIAMDGDSVYLYSGRKDGEWVGTAVQTFSKQGFSGYIWLMVGFLPDGTIHNIVVLEHKETPGLGDKMEQEKSFDKKTGKSWSSQFIGKHPDNFQLKVTKDGGDVDAITASTISSRAFCDAVNRAYQAFKEGGNQ
ncbi:MAG: RnfABCDGE type electron transport complex subunit G [Bacteroidales bacterium]